MFVSDLVDKWEPMAVRLALLDHARHQAWEWHDDLVPAAAARLERWREAGEGDGAREEVRAALDDDLDLPAALAAVDRAAGGGRGVGAAAELLGVRL